MDYDFEKLYQDYLNILKTSTYPIDGLDEKIFRHIYMAGCLHTTLLLNNLALLEVHIGMPLYWSLLEQLSEFWEIDFKDFVGRMCP